ncbi:response regulator, partial [Massilia arenosa]
MRRLRSSRFRGTVLALALALVLVGTGGPAPAAETPPVRTLRFEQLSVEQGLVQESVMAIAQDAQGFMWFGTQGGLARYDGYRVTSYHRELDNPRSLLNNFVRALHVDRKGRLWVGSDGGLDLWEPATRSFRHFVAEETVKRGNGNLHIHAIAEDRKGGLWIGTGDGLQYLDPETGKFRFWHHTMDPNSLADDRISSLALVPDGRLFIATGAGVDSLDTATGRFEHYRSTGPGAPAASEIQRVMADSHGTLWITSRSGLETRQLADPHAAPRRYGPADGLDQPFLTVLYEDPDGDVWIGSQGGGLYRWQRDQKRFVHFRHLPNDPHSLADNQIASLYRDRVGTFWIGTWFGGVSRADMVSGGFSRLVQQGDTGTAQALNKTRSVAVDAQNYLIAATHAGLLRINPATGDATRLPLDPAVRGLASDPVVTVAELDRNGVIWYGTHYGLSSYDPATGRHVTKSFGDADSDNIRYLRFDRAGTLWVTTRGGLYAVDPVTRSWHAWRHDPADPASLADNNARPLLEDRQGRIWVGNFNGLDLLEQRDGTSFRHFRNDPARADSLSHDEVHYLLEDHAGNIWVGTADGLNRMSIKADGTAVFRRYSSADGLADTSISAILEDLAGNIWVSTNSGVSRLDVKTGRFRNYGASDGTVEGGYLDGSAVRGRDGALYFGGFKNGITAFQPSAIEDNLIAPRAVLTDLQIFNRPVAAARPGLLTGPIEDARAITLQADDSVFSLEFSALHYAAPARNRFAYKLEGFDRDWVYADASRRFATYTNLDPATYVFRVRAANKDGVWGPVSAPLTIEILPPVWKTWWFRTGAALLALGAVGAGYRLRLSGLRRQKDLLARQVDERTEEIGQQNRQLERQAEELRQRREEAEGQRAEAELAHRHISTLSEIGRELTASLDLNTIMSTVYRHVQQLMDATMFGIGFYDAQSETIDFPFSIDHNVRVLPYRRLCSDQNQFAVWCLTWRREVFINDLDAEYGRYLESRDAVSHLPTVRVDGLPTAHEQSLMYVPLAVKDRLIGIICVQSPRKNAYEQVHLDMLRTLAAHAAVAFDNARAYRELEDTQARLVEQERQVRRQTDELARANTALQENEERLWLAKQRAEDATRQKSEFLANMSHEMRTPLAGVIGMLSFALRDPLLQETTRGQILRGQANAQALLTIINDLLDFSKIEAGKLTIENIDFDLLDTIGNVSALFEEQAGAHSVDFDIGLAPDLPRFVVGDPTRLRQVLVNLVGNAFKFTNDGFVRLQVERLPGAGTVSLIRFSVQDTGIGIAPDAIARLFQKFEQADSTTTRRYGGTGLGLAICRQLVQLMGGEITVDSKLGVGSLFTFTVPLADGVEPPLVVQVPRQPHTHRLRVLCAEDFPTNQIIIRMMLEDFGHRVDIVENGAQAVAACSQHHYDVILMDGRMPEMDGATAARLIRAGGTEDAPVLDRGLTIVALTANASEEDRHRYISAGMDEFLTKPLDEEALHHCLSRTIERQLARGVVLPLMSEPPPDSTKSPRLISSSTQRS